LINKIETKSKIPRIIAGIEVNFLNFAFSAKKTNSTTKAPPKNNPRLWAVPIGLKPATLAKSQGKIGRHKDWSKKRTTKIPELAKKIKRVFSILFLASILVSALPRRLVKKRNKRVYKIKLKRVSGSKLIPQKLWPLAFEKSVEIPKIKSNNKIDPVILFERKLNFPALIIFIIQSRSKKKANMASNICLFKTKGKRVKGKKKIGSKKTNRYKLYLIILSRIFSILA